MKKNKKIKQAVALQYNMQKDHAPKITASGQGMTAENIVKVAEESNIHVYQDEKLTKELIQFQVGTEIPAELYEIVAQILVFVETIDQKKGLLKKS
jgi:flagellar biosynthesis protein